MTTTPVASGPDASPRRLDTRPTGADRAFVLSARAIGLTVLVITGSIGLFLAYQAVPTLRHYGLSFFTTSQWAPESDQLGIAAVLVGTVSIAAVAIVIAFPLALATALFISEYAPARLRPLPTEVGRGRHTVARPRSPGET